jgi:hypothetical protein
MARGDWAVYDFVRAGIEARARLEHVVEERSPLCLHAQRIVHWAHRRLSLLLEVLDDPESQCFDLKRIIIHHYRVIISLLKVDAPGLLQAEHRALLLTLQRRIVETLDPERIAQVVVDRDDDADSVVSEQDGIDPEFDDEQLGEFIADRLREEGVEELERIMAERILEDVDEELGIIAGEEDLDIEDVNGDAGVIRNAMDLGQ